MLDYARIETGQAHYDIGDVGLQELVASVDPLIVPTLLAKSLDYEVIGSGAGVPSVTVRADREKVRQILLNLLTNAAKFTRPGGRIEVGFGASDRWGWLRVRDTGIGISGPELGRIFEPFVQVDIGRSPANDGVGLGLAISRDLSRAMGGDLTAESQLGVGSTFTLVLPVAPG